MPRSSLSILVVLALAATPSATVACGGGDDSTWTLSDATVGVTPDNRVSVDIVYVNQGDDSWGGSRCVVVDWEKGGVQSRDDVRAHRPPSSPIEIVETARFCNGGNKSLRGGNKDLFHVVSAHLRDDLVGSTVVVAAEDFRGTASDDRLTIPSP